MIPLARIALVCSIIVVGWLFDPRHPMAAAETASSGVIDARVTAFFGAYCLKCHGTEKQDGDFRIDQLRVSETDADAENWQAVLDKLHLGEMPPEDSKQPTLAEVEPITTWIAGELRRARAALGGQKGEVVLRRLNRLEYENTIEDLFGVRGDFAVGFPEDAIGGGFNNNGAALSLSSEQVTEYLKAADFVLQRVVVTQPRPETKSVAFTLADQAALDRKKWEEAKRRDASRTDATETEKKRRAEAIANNTYGPPYYPKYGDDSLIPVRYLRPTTRDFFRVNEPGWYRYKVTAYAVRNEGRPMRLSTTCGSGSTEAPPTPVDVVQLTDETPRDFEYRVYLQKNHLVTLEMLDGTNWLPGPKIADDRSPAIAIRRIELEGPLYDQWPPRGHRVLFGESESLVDVSKLSDEAVPGLLHDLAPKLFRRSVAEPVVADLLAYYHQQRQTATPLEAYVQTAKGMMASPLFLYHYEPADSDRGKADGYLLADRLSYFLWRSLPDAELTAAARQGTLSQPEELKRQTARLLADAKMERFLKDFVGQWLQIAKVGEMQPDKALYPEYDAELEQAMIAETEAFIKELLEKDLPLTNLIDSDWAMLNDRLAKHYGIDGVVGNKFRKVSLEKTRTVRGGLLTQASVLNVTSNGTTTSPVVRGVWILERLLGTPAPPPPPDVPAIEPDIRGASTIQEQLEKHRTIPQCAACHKKIDPYGMALENFDVIGAWRENYRALVQQKGRNRPQLGDGKPVTATGELPKLGPYQNFAAFRRLLLQNEDLVYRNVAEKLAVYALGRSMTFADRDDLMQIVKETRAAGGGLRTMIVRLVQSPLFVKP